jgi:hypothetical protein
MQLYSASTNAVIESQHCEGEDDDDDLQLKAHPLTTLKQPLVVANCLTVCMVGAQQVTRPLSKDVTKPETAVAIKRTTYTVT